jgi:cytochrome c oxidase assembly factor CtaG
VTRKIAFTPLGLLCVAPVSAAAHEGVPIAPHDLSSAWSFEPGVVVLLVLSVIVFVVGAAKLRARAGRWPARFSFAAPAFAAGWIVLAVSLVSPLHPLGSALFSAHMVQHELLMVAAAPLFIAARPMAIAVWSLPESSRVTVRRIFQGVGVAALWSVISRPTAAFLIHAAAIWLWHVPALFQLTIGNELAHTAQHASFFLTALVFWWTILPASGKGRSGVALLSLFLTAMHTSALGALLTFSGASWYPSYQATTGPWGLSPIEDQQLGGLIMWIPGGLTYLIVALLAGARLLREPKDRVSAAQPEIGALQYNAP